MSMDENTRDVLDYKDRAVEWIKRMGWTVEQGLYINVWRNDPKRGEKMAYFTSWHALAVWQAGYDTATKDAILKLSE